MEDFLKDAKDKFTGVNGLILHYLEWHRRHPDTVLLLHGAANCAATWHRLAAGLAPKHRVIAPDCRGHGDSAWADESSYTLDQHAADIAAMVAQLEIKRLALVGHSMGAAVAQRYAARHPEKVKKLVLIDNGPRFGQQAQKDARSRPPSPERLPSIEAAAAYLATGDPLAPPEVLLREAAFLTRPDGNGGLVWKSHLKTNLPPLTEAEITERWEILRQITCPTLIIRGSESPVFEAEMAHEMARLMPQAKVIEIPGAGHYVHRDNPEAFESAVLEFIG